MARIAGHAALRFSIVELAAVLEEFECSFVKEFVLIRENV